LPQHEQCNAKDDDCDGVADEGVLSPCGGCNPACVGGVWGPPADPFEASGELALTQAGELTLELHPLDGMTVWVPNTGDGTVSKVDAQSAQESARYRVPGTPERVAIDQDGDAWVLSPSLQGVSSLTKLAAGAPACVDRDGNGLRTSQGPDDVLTLGDDECVLLSTDVGADAELARALAIGGPHGPDSGVDHVYVGLESAQRVLELDADGAEVLRELPTPGLSPFDAAFDPWGMLWLVDRQGLLGRIDPGAASPQIEIHEAPLRCYELESLASDAAGVLTLSGASCEDVVTYDPVRDRFQALKTAGVLDTRGVTVLGAESWLSHTAGEISRVRRAPLAILGSYGLASDGFSPLESIAIGADSAGQIWTVSSSGAPHGQGVLSRFDPSSANVTAQVPVGRLPRGRGDITGDHRLGAFAPEASAQHVFFGCGGVQRDASSAVVSTSTVWQRVHVGWLGGGGARVSVEARRASSVDALAEDQSFVALGSLPDDDQPFALDFEPGGVVEVRLTLLAGGRLGAPRVARVGVEWRCPGPT